MTPAAAVERLNVILAHAWMVRRFLKHAEEIEDDEELIDVHRTVYDYIRATEPSFQRCDHAEYLRRIRGKLSKLRAAAATLEREYRRVSDHTNFQMAALSLSGCVKQIEEVLSAVESRPAGSTSPAPAAAPPPSASPGAADPPAMPESAPPTTPSASPEGS